MHDFVCAKDKEIKRRTKMEGKIKIEIQSNIGGQRSHALWGLVCMRLSSQMLVQTVTVVTKMFRI